MHKQEGPVDTSKGYEVSDLPVGGIVKGVVAFIVFSTVSIVAALLYLLMVPQGVGVVEPVQPKIFPQPPNPLLQNNVTATVDLWRMRAEERKALHSTGWVDKQRGIAHIPIEDAIDDEAAKMGGSK